MDGYLEEVRNRVNALPVGQLEARRVKLLAELRVVYPKGPPGKGNAEASAKEKRLRQELRGVVHRQWLVKASRENLCVKCGRLQHGGHCVRRNK
jgi:hypothetical protein